uniref:Protein tweety homolog n=1 Tax=Theropithecus gelada TaxID=9565 RepID=A0A8D2EPM7_THEGE
MGAFTPWRKLGSTIKSGFPREYRDAHQRLLWLWQEQKGRGAGGSLKRLTLSQRALANIHSQLLGLEREAVPQFPSAQKPLLSLEETLNVTEGNFHQLVALLHCRGLHKDYGAALRGLCEDALEGLLFLLLFSLLSAGALATALCSLPRAWALFPPSDDYDDTDDDDPFNPQQESKRFVQWQSSI